MLKASFNLPNGTLVTIEGDKEDVRDLLDHYSNASPVAVIDSHLPKAKSNIHEKSTEKKADSHEISVVSSETLTQIVNKIKSCPEAEAIERNILGKAKPTEADRVLLPLYIVHKYFENSFGLTTVEIEAITTELGPKIKVNRQNANRQFVRKSTSRLVLSDTRRKVGAKVKYTLNDRGIQYIESVLAKLPPDK